MKHNDLMLCSQRLAYILRHSQTIDRQPGGWISMSDVANQTGYQADVIKKIVSMDEKGRFEIDKTTNLIRALYGHSAHVNMGYDEVKPPSILLHGTASYATQQIMLDGLKPRSRQFVHLTDDLDMAINTGKRHGDSSVLSIDADKMYENGFKFHNPAPHVWLVPSVPAQYIEPMGEVFEEVNDNWLKQKLICAVNIDTHGITFPKSSRIGDYTDFYHISQYKTKDCYKLIIVFVNEYDDWKKWQSKIEKIKVESPNFLLFYTYEVQGNADMTVPYFKTTLYPNEILCVLDSVLFGGNPLSIDYNDFTTLLLEDEKDGTLYSFNVFDTYKNNRLISYIKNLDCKKVSNILIHFTIPTRANDTSQFSTYIQDSIAAIPSNVDYVWGCSFADNWELSVSVFEK